MVQEISLVSWISRLRTVDRFLHLPVSVDLPLGLPKHDSQCTTNSLKSLIISVTEFHHILMIGIDGHHTGIGQSEICGVFWYDLVR